MRTRMARDYPAWLERLRRRFDRWRQTCDGRSRIPEVLWASAVKAVSRYGLNPTARALRLDYYSLKRRVEATASRSRSERRPAVEFIELASPLSGSAPECVLELEHPRGAKMRVQLKGTRAPDLTALSEGFWKAEVRPREPRRRRP